jgi:hypothetical protein
MGKRKTYVSENFEKNSSCSVADPVKFNPDTNANTDPDSDASLMEKNDRLEKMTKNSKNVPVPIVVIGTAAYFFLCMPPNTPPSKFEKISRKNPLILCTKKRRCRPYLVRHMRINPRRGLYIGKYPPPPGGGE